jgi:hypothetical protein
MARNKGRDQTIKAVIPSRQPAVVRVSVDALAAIPEESVWLESRKSPQTRRAYRVDVAHFMRTFGISTPEELRKIDHRAVMAWEPDFSVVLFRPAFMLASEKYPMKAHKNQLLLARLCPPDSLREPYARGQPIVTAVQKPSQRPCMRRLLREVCSQLIEKKALSWGIIRKSACILAKITIRKSQVVAGNRTPPCLLVMKREIRYSLFRRPIIF